MKKKLTRWSMRKLTVSFFLLLVMAVHARQVTPDEAAAIASEFLNSSSPQLATARRVGVKRAQARTDAGDNSPRPYYVFTGDDNRGFVIISGDDRTKPILGYSHTNTFDFDNLPPGLEWMLGQYEKEIEALSASATETRAEYAASDTRGEIEPLLTTKWGQGEPYNNKCPVISGQHAMTGCVATAFAQVMNYHKWPERGRGSHSYHDYWSGNAYSIDFSQIAFDWDAMSDVYDGNSSERSKDAVATLMKACGYSIDMKYDIQESGTSDGLIPNAAHKFFDYSTHLFCASRLDYTSEDWETIIYHQLSKGLPVIYSGYNNEYVGHCYVCDGYDGEGLFHFNWGWNGAADGYFLLTRHLFDKSERCILNFYPSNKESDYTPSFSDGTFVYDEIGQGNLVLVGLADSDNKLYGDVVLPNETVINGTRYAVTSIWCRFSDILDLENLTSLDIRIPVASIPDFTFDKCLSLTSIEIPSSVTRLGDYCLSGCSSLTSIEIPSSVTSLGNNCFTGCSSLASIELPSSVTSLGSGCFSGCSSLASIELPSSVTSLGGSCFSGCSSFESIVVDAANPKYDSRESCNAIIETESNTMIVGCKNTRIPSSVTSLGECCFWGCSSLTSIEIPSSVTSLGNSCFSGCSSLTSIEIPSSVTSLGECCFWGCSSLKSIEIPSSVTSLEFDCFSGCSSLTSIEIPSSVTSLGIACFSSCSSLTSIEIPSSVTSLGNSCFSGCWSLTSIEIPSSVTSLGDYCFLSCSSLASIDIPSSVTSLGDNCFLSCWSLTSIRIPSSVTSLGYRCFGSCPSLESIVVDAANPVYDSRESCNAIIETESNTMIAGCKNTKIPSSVTSLGDWCFNNCWFLTSIRIPSSVTSLGDNCFLGCSSLTSIEIPSSVTSLGYRCFGICGGLTSVVSKIKEPFEVTPNTFENIPSECTLTIPRGTREAYMVAGWTEDIFGGGIVEAPYNLAADNYLTLSYAEACNGSGVVLPVDMRNSEAITALQFELSLPTGVTLSDCLLTGRKGDHTVSYSRLSNGNYQVIVFSMNNRNFLGSEGALLELSLDVDEGVPSGDYPVVVKNIELTTSDTQPVNPDDARATLTVSDVKPADANGDGKISVTDVVAIVNYILGKRTEGFRFAAADMDGNGKITITDAVAVVNKILGSDASAKERGTAARLDPQ